MNWIDFIVVLAVVLAVGCLVFFRYIFPRIKFHSGNKIVQAYRKKYNKK
jgi:hypothetical protein